MIKRACLLAAVLLAGSLAWAQTTVARSVDPGEGDYTIGVEDVLRIVVWGEPELTMNVAVRPDGKVTVPLANDIHVVGLTPMVVRDKISKELATYIKNPNVTVIVEQMNSFRVYFLGEVRQPGAIQFNSPTRLLQAVAMAGGPTEFSKKKITLLREQGGIEKRFVIDYKKLLAGDIAQQNIFLEAGDTLLFD